MDNSGPRSEVSAPHQYCSVMRVTQPPHSQAEVKVIFNNEDRGHLRGSHMIFNKEKGESEPEGEALSI